MSTELINHEIVKTFIYKDTIETVKKLFKSNVDRTPIKSHDLQFRLIKPTNYNVNLEIFTEIKLECSEEEVDLGSMGKGIKFKTVSFFKPIGYYCLKKGLFSNSVGLTIVKEYEDSLDFLIKNKKVPSTIKINKLPLRHNALIAAFSKESRIEASKNEDRFSFFANGLILDIYMSEDGYPQVFLDDKYGIEGAIAKYRLYDKPGGIDPITKYKELFDSLYEMRLFTSVGKDLGQ